MADLGDYLTTREVADLLGVTKARVDQFRKERRLEGVPIGNAVVYRRKDVMAFKKLKRRSGRKKGYSPKNQSQPANGSTEGQS